MSVDPSTHLNSPRAPKAVGPYPHARRVGNLLFLSGVGPREPGTGKIPGNVLDDAGNVVRYDIAAQCRSVFDNVRHILEDAGSSWNEMVDLNVHLTNILQDFATLNPLDAEHFSDVQPGADDRRGDATPTPIAIELKVIAGEVR